MPSHETETSIGLKSFIAGRGTGKVPCRVSVSGGLWRDSTELFESLRELAPDVSISGGGAAELEHEITKPDKWGCDWHFPGDYLDGQVIGHPLSDWDAYRDYEVPDPSGYCDWEAEAVRVAELRAKGDTAWGNVEHGFLYLRMTYLRGFENFMIDLAERRAELWELRERITDFWVEMVRRYAEIGVDAISFGDDLGHQDSLPMSPQLWRDLLKPGFKKIYDLCRENGIAVYMHTDGWILDIIPDLIESGVDILNPQDLVNGLDNLARLAKGKVAMDLDIDRQSVTVFGSPAEINQHIHRCIETLGSPEGRLMLLYGVYRGTPTENIAACVEAMQKYHDMWAGR